MSSNKFDPLANLFSTAQLSGLSGSEGKAKEENPLGIDFEALDPKSGVLRPKTPPKPKDDVAPEDLLDRDDALFEDDDEPPSLEEAPEAEDPVLQAEVQSEEEEVEEQDPEIALRLALAQQALMRAKIKRDRERQVKKEEEEDLRREEEAKKSQVADRLANISSNSNKSAMDVFLEAMDEDEAPKRKPKAKSKKKKNSDENKPKSMKEAASAMEKKPLMANALSLSMTALIQNHLPSLTEFHVASAMDSFNRSHLKVMWMTKRTQFLQSGKLEYAVASLSVLDALERLDDGDLIAAYVETTASDYLIWVDRENNKLVAAFANAGEYFG